MKYPEFILAKYVPDLSRMEPRNIGIFLWWKGTLCAKFLDDIEAIRKKDRASYREFVSDWNRMIDNKAIETVRGKVVPTSSPLCLKTILENEEDSFLFVDAGHVSSAIKKSEIESRLTLLTRVPEGVRVLIKHRLFPVEQGLISPGLHYVALEIPRTHRDDLQTDPERLPLRPEKLGGFRKLGPIRDDQVDTEMDTILFTDALRVPIPTLLIQQTIRSFLVIRRP